MDNHLISVVVPIYATEPWLQRCVDSILAQSYTNLEIILINDGSPDNCGLICDDYASRNKRITVIHQKNSGLSAARNVGVRMAQGEYVCYIDSDDWVAPDYVEHLYNLLVENNAQISVCGTRLKYTHLKHSHFSKERILILTGEQALQDMLYQKNFDTNAWGKLYHISLARMHPFPIGKWYEDLFTIYKMLFSSKTVVVSDWNLYYYFLRENSIMNLPFSEKRFEQIEATEEIIEFVSCNCPKLLPSAFSRKFSSCVQVLMQMQRNQTQNEHHHKIIWQYIREYRYLILKDGNTRLKNRTAAVISYFGDNLLRLTYHFMKLFTYFSFNGGKKNEQYTKDDTFLLVWRRRVFKTGKKMHGFMERALPGLRD